MRLERYFLLLVTVAAACGWEEPPGESAAVDSVTPIDSASADSASAPTDPAAFDWRAHLGRVESDPDRVLCLIAGRGTVSAGDSLWLVSDGLDSQPVEMGVTGASGACSSWHNDLEEVFPVTLISSPPESTPVRIAVLGNESQVEVRDGLAVADLDQNGELEYFGFCASVEGLHLTVWTGQVAEGVRRWHTYHPLHYDLEPNCTEAETNEPYD